MSCHKRLFEPAQCIQQGNRKKKQNAHIVYELLEHDLFLIESLKQKLMLMKPSIERVNVGTL